MKKRIISAIIALAIFIPIIILGGNIFKVAISILGVFGLKELINIRETKKKIPSLIKVFSYILVCLLILNNSFSKEIVFNIDYMVISIFAIFSLLPVIFINNNDKYNISDAMFIFGSILFIGIAFNMFLILRNYDIKYFILLFLITISTDTFAYISGSLSGRTKLCPKISPKKTVEGFVIGSIFGTLITCTYYYMNINDSANLFYLILIILFLTLLGQLGDMFFSTIKRYYNKKDFSNIMPGHGGILDRLDSVIFVVYGLIIFLSIL